MSLLNNNVFNRSLVSLAERIGRDPQLFQQNFNRHLQPSGRNRNNQQQQLRPAVPTQQHGHDPDDQVQQNEDNSEEPVEGQYHTSEPVHLNSILFNYFGFDHSEELFEENEEFLRKICDLTPSTDPEWSWVWKKDQNCQNFSEDENYQRVEFFVGIWEDECFKRPHGPLYPHEEEEEELLKEAEEMRREMQENMKENMAEVKL